MRAIFGERYHAVAWQAGHAEKPHIADADRTLYEPKIGLFGVFDGVGYTGAPAAEAAVRYVSAHDSELTSPRKLAAVLAGASGKIYRNHDTHKSMTTATVAKLISTDNGARALWASVGDSRLYHVGPSGQAKQVSRDEGQGNIVNNALGQKNCKVEQYGEFELARGEGLILVTDGITGDTGKEVIGNDELSRHFRMAQGNPEFVAHLLLRVARKYDDRTVIVVKMND